MTTPGPKTKQPPILLVIDLQQGLVEGPSEWGPRSTPDLIKNVTYLLSTWRSRNWPIIHIHHDDIADPTNPIASIHPTTYAPHACSAPLPNEPIFVKNVGSPFVATELPAAIKNYGGEREIVVIGMDGTQCVNNTTRHGVDLGYKMVVVGDACASYGIRDWRTGKEVGEEATHNLAMGILAGDARVTSTKEVLAVLGYE